MERMINSRRWGQKIVIALIFFVFASTVCRDSNGKVFDVEDYGAVGVYSERCNDSYTNRQVGRVVIK